MPLDPLPIEHRLPQELFERIILRLIPANLSDNYFAFWLADQKVKKQLKHDLGQCSLVCRYWAKHCRSRIFEELILQTPEDALKLLDFLKVTTVGMNVGAYVKSMTINLTLPSSPWVHLIYNVLPRTALPKLGGYALSVKALVQSTGVDEPPPFAPRTIFFGLPRSLPATKRGLSITLDGLHFKTFSDLVSFADSMMAVKDPRQSSEIELAHVSWADQSSLMPSATPDAFTGKRRQFMKFFPSITATGCTAIWPLLWLLVTAERPTKPAQHENLHVDAAEVRRLSTLVQAIVDDCSCSYCCADQSQHDKSVPIIKRPPIKGARDTSIIAINKKPHLITAHISSEGLITKFEIQVDDDLHLHSPGDLNFNWAALDKHAAAFNATMTHLEIELPEAAYETWAPFVRDNMPAMESGGRLKLELPEYVTRRKGKGKGKAKGVRA